jgi:hypothetical protein
MRSFNERECHPEKGTLYPVCVKGCSIQALQSTKSTPAGTPTAETPSDWLAKDCAERLW